MLSLGIIFVLILYEQDTNSRKEKPQTILSFAHNYKTVKIYFEKYFRN